MEVTTMLWTYREIKKQEKNYVPGEFEVRIRLSLVKDRKYIQLGYSTSLENWDEKNELPKSTHPHYKKLSQEINKYLSDIDFELKLAERNGQYITPIEIKRKVTHEDQNTPAIKTQLKILEYFDQVIDNLETNENPGYADVFTACRSTVSKLLNERDKPFLSFTKADHQAYQKLISVDTSESTISHYLRTYYRIWNLAIKDNYCTKEDHHPSKFITFQAYKKIRTKKRSINQDYLAKIMELKFDPGSRKFRNLQYLKFMYYARGMNFGDMCKLKRQQIANGGITYTRSKNHREYDFILHSEALAVVNFFKDYPVQSDGGYVFPIVRSYHDTARKIDQRVESALKDFNEDVKQFAKDVNWERKFTSNSLRAGFATHLRNNNVHISIIKEALGHEVEAQTNVYLDDIDDQPIADAINDALNPKPKPVQKKKRLKV